MDLKVPSATGMRAFWAEHRAFLEVCGHYGLATWAKVVIASDTLREEIVQAARIVAETYPEAIMVLQPASPTDSFDRGPEIRLLLELQGGGLADP